MQTTNASPLRSQKGKACLLLCSLRSDFWVARHRRAKGLTFRSLIVGFPTGSRGTPQTSHDFWRISTGSHLGRVRRMVSRSGAISVCRGRSTWNPSRSASRMGHELPSHLPWVKGEMPLEMPTQGQIPKQVAQVGHLHGFRFPWQSRALQGNYRYAHGRHLRRQLDNENGQTADFLWSPRWRSV